MAIARTKSELQDLTPALVAAFAAYPGLPGERELKSAHLAFLRQRLEGGTFLGVDWAVGVQRETGTRYRADGQHSSRLLADVPPEEFPSDLRATITTYEFDSLDEDGYVLFNLFNHPKSVRTNTDLMGVYRAHHEDLGDLPNGFLRNVAAGIDFYRREQRDPDLFTLAPRDQGVYWQEAEHRAFARWLWTFHEARHFWMVKKAGLVAEILSDVSTADQADLAREFWAHVLAESHPDEDHESRELARELLKMKQGQKKISQKDLRKLANKVWRRYCRMVVHPAAA